jgi:HD-GYP domain-containing protein (c-di-GMP phosphodiesterase class II)
MRLTLMSVRRVLRTVPGIPPEVISIVHEHHENSAGEGYPRRLDDGKINPLSKIVGLGYSVYGVSFAFWK